MADDLVNRLREALGKARKLIENYAGASAAEARETIDKALEDTGQ